MTCNQPDRDEPRIKCGYPLPCPHHTLTIEPKKSEITIPKGRRITASALKRVDQVTRVLSKDTKGRKT